MLKIVSTERRFDGYDKLSIIIINSDTFETLL